MRRRYAILLALFAVLMSIVVIGITLFQFLDPPIPPGEAGAENPKRSVLPKDLSLLLECLAFGGMLAAVVGLALKFGFRKHAANSAANNLLAPWWVYAGFTLFFSSMALMQIGNGRWSFMAFFAALGVVELFAMGWALLRRPELAE